MRRTKSLIVPAVALSLPFLMQLAFALGAPDWGTFGSPTLLFWIVVIAASLCAVTAGLVLWRAHRTDAPELSWVGLFFYSVSILPLVHGITTPGVLYGPNAATMSSVVLAIPLGLLAAAPIFFGRNHPIGHRWREWAGAWLAGLTTLAVAMCVVPDAIPVLNARSPFGVVLLGSVFVGCLALGLRQVQLARIAQRPGPLFVAGGYALVAGSIGVLFGAQPYSTGFWFAHALDICGVFLATIGAFIVFRRSDSIRDVLAPIVAVDPIAALEVGMHPDVASFVDMLESKDQRTRDHVVRTAELAVEVAQRMGLPPETQREAGLAGALHDIGKLHIPEEILNKPGKLTDTEWRFMRGHAAAGAEIVAGSEPLAMLAPIVRAHHERIDGGGYPDGLSGDAIPVTARIVAACDAFDAMAYTRSYREGMDLDKVFAILREHAGTQWDPTVVDAVIASVSRRRNDWSPALFRQRAVDTGHDRCDCLPDEVSAETDDAHGVLVSPGRQVQLI